MNTFLLIRSFTLYPLLFTALFAACATLAPKPAKTGYNFKDVKRMAIGTFEGQGGDAVGHEFVRQLVAAGFTVTDQKQNAEVVLTGTVTGYHGADKMLIFIGNAKFPGAKEQSVTVTNPIVNGAMATDVSAFELPKMQVMAVSASVNVTVHLADVKTSEILWTQSASDEGLTMASAIQAMTSTLVHALRRLVPTATAAHA